MSTRPDEAVIHGPVIGGVDPPRIDEAGIERADVDRAGIDRAGNDEVWAALGVLVGTDLAVCGFDELDVVRGACQRLRGFVAATDVRVARRARELAGSITEPIDPTGGPGDAPAPGGADPGDVDGPGDAEGPGDDGSGDPAAEGPADGRGGSSGGGRPGDRSAFGGTRDRRSPTATERDHDRARVFASMPSFEAALAAGRVDVAHADALVAAFGRIDHDEVRDRFVAREPDLVAAASAEAPERFRRRCADLVRRLAHDHGVETASRQRDAASTRQWWDHRTGMFHLHLEVEPELGARIETAIGDHLATVRARDTGDTWQRLRVDAVAELITHSGALHPRTPELVVLVDWDTVRTGSLATGATCETHGGHELTPATARRLACDADILPIVLGGEGIPLDVGRTRRLATREQRRALRAMYRTCAHPRCDRPFDWCRIHHVTPWEHAGPTNLDTLIPLCDRHHHLVHEDGWTLTMAPDRTCTWTTPTGRTWYHGDTRDALPLHDACHDACHDTFHDTGHEAGHDAGHHAGHEAGHHTRHDTGRADEPGPTSRPHRTNDPPSLQVGPRGSPAVDMSRSNGRAGRRRPSHDPGRGDDDDAP